MNWELTLQKLEIDRSTQFKKDFNKALKLPFEDLKEIFDVMSLLENQQTLKEKYRDHKLTGNWSDFRECHIKPDLLLIYRVIESELQLARLGSHAELFKQ